MAFVKIPLLAGIFTDDSPLSAEGFFVDADKVRFVRGKFQTIGGWEKASTDTFSGKARGSTAWIDNSGNVWAGFGTHLRLYAYSDGEIYDITRIIERGELTNPFDTTDGDETVTVNDTAHGLIDNQKVKFSNASAVGGITPDGEYVVTYVDANSYTIEHSSAATSTVSGGGGTVDYEYFEAPGNEDTTGGLGYGTGAFGVGAYGAASSVDYYARTWDLAHWDRNLLAVSRGGVLQEWAPNVTNSETVTNGGFATDTDWTKGSGWSIGSGVASATTSTAALAQSITLAPATWYYIEADVTVSAGGVTPSWNSVNIGAEVTATATVKRTFYSDAGGAQTLALTGTTSFTGTIDNVTVKALLTAEVVPNAPTQSTCMIVTEEMICMLGGTIDVETGQFNPRHIRWSDTGVGDLSALQTWTPTAANLSGSFTIQTGSRIVGMANGNQETLVWTDEGLHVGRYVENPNIVYSFFQVGHGCGLIGPNAKAVAGSAAYWLSNGGDFWAYDGGAVVPLQSPVRRYVEDNLAKVQGDKVYAYHLSAFNEVWWLYPDSRDGNECSRYVIYNYQTGEWSIGTFNRTQGIDAGPLRYPVLAGTDGYLYYHEKSNSADGTDGIDWSITTGQFDIGDGNTLFQISSVIPDFEDLVGGVELTVRTYTYPNNTPTTFGPYSITSGTDKVDFIAIGRQADMTFSSTAVPAFARQGSVRVDLSDTGMIF